MRIVKILESRTTNGFYFYEVWFKNPVAVWSFDGNDLGDVVWKFVIEGDFLVIKAKDKKPVLTSESVRYLLKGKVLAEVTSEGRDMLRFEKKRIKLCE